jgi:hypothetical protein
MRALNHDVPLVTSSPRRISELADPGGLSSPEKHLGYHQEAALVINLKRSNACFQVQACPVDGCTFSHKHQRENIAQAANRMRGQQEITARP